MRINAIRLFVVFQFILAPEICIGQIDVRNFKCADITTISEGMFLRHANSALDFDSNFSEIKTFRSIVFVNGCKVPKFSLKVKANKDFIDIRTKVEIYNAKRKVYTFYMDEWGLIFYKGNIYEGSKEFLRFFRGD
jgi:hypothetical protein